MCRVPNFGTILILLYRALADVEALDRVLMKTELVNLLSNLPVRSAAQQLGMWISQKSSHNRVTHLLAALGKRVTNAQAKRLDELGLSYNTLLDLRLSSKNVKDFSKTLQKRGVRSKCVRQKLSAMRWK